MRLIKLGGAIAVGALALATLTVPAAQAAAAPATAAATATASTMSAVVGGPQITPHPVRTQAVAVTSPATKAVCDALVAKAKAEIAATGKSSQPASCAYLAPSAASSASRAVATPNAGPPPCDTPADASWYGHDGERRSACLQGGGASWVITRTSDGVVTGRGGIKINMTMYEPDTTFPQWFTSIGVSLDRTVTTGTGFPTGITGSVRACTTTSAVRCQSAGTLRTVTPGNVWLGDGNEIVTTSGTGFSAPLNDGWALSVTGGWTNPIPLFFAFAPSRCDNYFPGGSNCVFVWVPGVWFVPTKQVYTFAVHISGAMQSGLPGNVLGSLPLHRITNTTLINSNRNKACPSSGYPRPTPTGYQCDEFPFASTQEGARTTPYPGPARTQPQCQMPKDPTGTLGISGFSRCYILALDNSRSGGLTNAFFNSQRIADGDTFKVGFDNTGM